MLYNLEEVGDAMVKTLVKELSKYGLGNSKLANSITYKINKNVLTLDMNEYGVYLDSGTKPHMPPVDSLNEWANDHNINVWALAYSINENGTKAKTFLDSIEDNLFEYSEILENEMLFVIEDEVDKIINKYFKNIEFS
jgi:basic membrane lipoprotein Med (substrate-binding protein (PBP1-ABC) superfamily)